MLRVHRNVETANADISQAPASRTLRTVRAETRASRDRTSGNRPWRIGVSVRRALSSGGQQKWNARDLQNVAEEGVGMSRNQQVRTRHFVLGTRRTCRLVQYFHSNTRQISQSNSCRCIVIGPRRCYSRPESSHHLAGKHVHKDAGAPPQ